MEIIKSCIDLFLHLDVHLVEIFQQYGTLTYAILFLIFDVEVIFLLPFAVAFFHLPAAAALAMLVFVLLLAEGLVWAWKKGILNWR